MIPRVLSVSDNRCKGGVRNFTVCCSKVITNFVKHKLCQLTTKFCMKIKYFSEKREHGVNQQPSQQGPLVMFGGPLVSYRSDQPKTHSLTNLLPDIIYPF